MAMTLAQLVVLQTTNTMVMSSIPDSDTELMKEFMDERGTQEPTNRRSDESDTPIEERTKGVKQQMNPKGRMQALKECMHARKRRSDERGEAMDG